MMKKITDFLEGSKPQVFSATFKISLSKSAKVWAHALSDVGFNSIEIFKSSLKLKKVFSSDLNSIPVDYIDITLDKNSITICYTCPKTQNQILRKIESAQLALLVLGSLGYSKLGNDFCAYTNDALNECLQLSSRSQSDLVFENTQLLAQISQIRQTTNSLSQQCEKDARIINDQKNQIDNLRVQIDSLTKVSSSAVDEIVLNWLMTYNAELCLGDICKQYSLHPAQVEQSLHRLCKSGIIKKV